jgi:hypothetical protein
MNYLDEAALGLRAEECDYNGPHTTEPDRRYLAQSLADFLWSATASTAHEPGPAASEHPDPLPAGRLPASSFSSRFGQPASMATVVEKLVSGASRASRTIPEGVCVFLYGDVPTGRPTSDPRSQEHLLALTGYTWHQLRLGRSVRALEWTHEDVRRAAPRIVNWVLRSRGQEAALDMLLRAASPSDVMSALGLARKDIPYEVHPLLTADEPLHAELMRALRQAASEPDPAHFASYRRS